MRKILLTVCSIFLFLGCEKNDTSDEYSATELTGQWVSTTIIEDVPLGHIWGNGECLYAVGGALGVNINEHLGTILKKTNGEWVVEKADFDARLVLLGIAGVSCNEIYAVGRIADGLDSGILLKFNGLVWEEIRGNINFTKIKVINGIVYITTWDGLYKIESDELVKIYDSNDFIVTDVWGIQSKLFIVGYNLDKDYIMKFDGTSWSAMLEEDKLQGNYLDHIEGISENEIYATGTGGNVLKYDGASWETLISGLLPVGGFKIYESKEFYIATSRYLTGNKIYKYNIELNELTTVFEADIPFYGLWGSIDIGIYALGLNGTIVHNDIIR
ncbi:hypothetical protein [Maribacter forsetii]|uniref:hypothetical protein n=1 Tax=Maribacter forsetii TaxID=444515 RepID=UPI000565717B|nr:hypothetical protein [Maribacter forsetii]